MIIGILGYLPPNTKRVNVNTKDEVNERIYQHTLYNLRRFKDKSFDAISERLDELNEEWDTERVLETSAGSVVLIGIILGFLKHYYWLILAGLAGGFLLVHALQGWCPPLPFIRKMGIRTPHEINAEKTALKFFRGDYEEIPEDVKDLLNIIITD